LIIQQNLEYFTV